MVDFIGIFTYILRLFLHRLLKLYSCWCYPCWQWNQLAPSAHFVWITKYRYKILRGNIALRLKELLKQGCDAKGLKILKGSIGSDHVHMLLSCPTNLSPNQIAQYLKGRSFHLIQEEFPELKKRYWGQHLWTRGYFCGTVGEVDEEMIKRYIENQGKEEDADNFEIVEE